MRVAVVGTGYVGLVTAVGLAELGHTVTCIDIDERKVAALMCHKSQMPDPDSVAQRIREWARGNAELAGLAEGSSAELFRVVSIP